MMPNTGENRKRLQNRMLLTPKEVDRLRKGVANHFGEFYGKALYTLGFNLSVGTNEVRYAIEGKPPYDNMPTWVHKPVMLKPGLQAYPEQEEVESEVPALGHALQAAGITHSELDGTPRSDITNLPGDKVWVWGRMEGHDYAHFWKMQPNSQGLQSACGRIIDKADLPQFYRTNDPPLCMQCSKAHGAILSRLAAEAGHMPVSDRRSKVTPTTKGATGGITMNKAVTQEKAERQHNYDIVQTEYATKKEGTKEWGQKEIRGWLTDRLKGGPVESLVLYKEAWELGIPSYSLKRAKQALHISHRREGNPRDVGVLASVWFLPGSTAEAEQATKPEPQVEPEKIDARPNIGKMLHDAVELPSVGKMLHDAVEVSKVPEPVSAPTPKLNNLVQNLIEAAWEMSGHDLRGYGFYTKEQLAIDRRGVEDLTRHAVSEIEAAIELVREAIRPLKEETNM